MHAADLKAAAITLVRRLGGVWYGDYGMCRCPAHADRNPSLSIRPGDRALLFTCFAGCDRRKVIQALRHIDHQALSSGAASSHRASYLRSRDGQSDAWLRQRAEDLWMSSAPLVGTQAAFYLQRRALTTLPPALRFCAAAPLGRGRELRYRPAMVAAVQQGGQLLAVQRRFLDWHAPRSARDLSDPCRMLGRPRAGAVMLAQAGAILGLAEGIETAMSARAILDIPVWATLGANRLAAIALPACVKHVVLLPDRDAAGRAGAARALETYRAAGLLVSVLWTPPGYKDWNDVLRKGGKGGGIGGARWTEWLARCRQE